MLWQLGCARISVSQERRLGAQQALLTSFGNLEAGFWRYMIQLFR